jgi:myo-inositol-1-phosphate synthase
MFSSSLKISNKRQSTIEHWARTGRVPAQWQMPLMSLGRQKGVILEAKDFVELKSNPIQPAEGRLGILLVGLGAVASTFISGVEHARRGSGQPVGSLTQMGTIRLGKRTENRSPLIREFVPLANLDDIVFGTWDPFPDNAYEAAVKCGVLDRHEHIEPIADFLQSINPMPTAFDQYYVKRLNGPNVKRGTKMEMVEQIRADIRNFNATLEELRDDL